MRGRGRELFVNPTQFDERADLDRYPRRESEDRQLAAAAGADILFAPAPEEVYPHGFATTVEVRGLTERLEGEARGSGHFRGVTTVVTKLLCMVAPDVAYFGQKDAQQVLVIRRLVADLNLPVRIEALPTVREPDGLALSSRNARLTAEQRRRALALPAALAAARTRVAAGARSGAAVASAAEASIRAGGLEPEYVAVRRPRHARATRGDRPRGAAGGGGPRRRGALDRQHRPGRAGVRATRVATPTRRGAFHMQRVMLKSKIHRATVSDSDLHYVGSITIDPDLLEAADIREHEQVHVVDVDNGARFETYTIAGERGAGGICVNGAAARLVHRGDTIIVISYGHYDEADLERYRPRVVHVEADTNRIITIDDEVATLLS